MLRKTLFAVALSGMATAATAGDGVRIYADSWGGWGIDYRNYPDGRYGGYRGPPPAVYGGPVYGYPPRVYYPPARHYPPPRYYVPPPRYFVPPPYYGPPPAWAPGAWSPWTGQPWGYAPPVYRGHREGGRDR